jgi:uncharacterized protein (DUF2252 family)
MAIAQEPQARGKAARALTPRRSHADWAPAPGRPDPISLLESQAASRVPELVPIRHGRMLVSPFAFYRGAALIMAADLAETPSSGIDVQLCGDAHLSNFGVFGTPERRFAFDLNDFDETHRGPWEWDVKRLAASLVVAGRERGFSDKHRTAAVLAGVGAYRLSMRNFAAMSNLDVFYAHLDVDELVAEYKSEFDRRMVARTEAELAKARTRDSMRAFEKLTEIVDGEPRIAADPPLIVPIEDLAGDVERDALYGLLRKLFAGYRRTLPGDRRRLFDQYRLVHVARKVVGVGSVGTRVWIALFLDRDTGDPLFLQVKEAERSVLEPYTAPSEYDNSGHRVVAGQRLMQSASDMFLGYKRVEAAGDGARRDFYVRQLHDWKGSANIEQMKPQGMATYARLCGWTLARAHARSGDRIAIAGYLGSGPVFDEALVPFAESYADQNERDHRALADAVASGRVEAVSGL